VCLPLLRFQNYLTVGAEIEGLALLDCGGPGGEAIPRRLGTGMNKFESVSSLTKVNPEPIQSGTRIFLDSTWVLRDQANHFSRLLLDRATFMHDFSPEMRGVGVADSAPNRTMIFSAVVRQCWITFLCLH
jgi:hypothetical protein